MINDLRHEIKLVCTASQVPQARSWIRLHPEGFRPTFAPRQVNNLYLDTINLNSFQANLAGTSTRQKLRLRWYGTDHLDQVTHPVLELKYKTNLLGGKQQAVLDCVLEWQRPYTELLALIRQAAGPMWQPWLSGPMQPTLINHYQREYYATPDGEMRVTLDFQQQAYDQQLHRYPNLRQPLLLPPTAVIEIKAASAHIDRLQTAVAYFPIPRSRNSKYVNAISYTFR